MVRIIARQPGGLAALKLTKLFGIDNFPAAKDSGKVLIIIIYCYLIIIILGSWLVGFMLEFKVLEVPALCGPDVPAWDFSSKQACSSRFSFFDGFEGSRSGLNPPI